MQISSITAAAAPRITAANQITSSEPVGSSTAKTSSRPPLFVDGLANWSALLSPDTMRAMFELNADGSVKTDSRGIPAGAGGKPVPQDTAEERLLYSHVLSQRHAADNNNQQSSVTDQQKKFFHDVTGYNLNVEDDGSWGVYDDKGNLVPAAPPGGGESNATWQLAAAITLRASMPSEGKGAADATSTAKWFADFIDNMKKGGVIVPDAWLTRAQTYFNGAAGDDSGSAPDANRTNSR
jgi:hypothetical protein